jgi:hypothetical protein
MSDAKEEMRKRLKALSFAEKIKILKKLRDRSLLLARSGLRASRSADVPEQSAVEKEKE